MSIKDRASSVGKIHNIAITGATGFLGSHLTTRLLKEGQNLRLLARDIKKAERFKKNVDKLVVADICDREAVSALVEGCDVVIHLVSNFRTASGSPDSYRRINVGGTKNVLEASKSAGVRRFIYCSTIGVHGHVNSTPANEESPYNPGDLYQETKMEAELVCHDLMKQDEMDITIIRPCSMYGPGDMRMLKMFKMLVKHKFFLVGPCKEHFHAVYIDDIVNGFLRAIRTPGVGGETIIIGGKDYVPLEDYIATAAKAVGTPKPTLRFPYWMFYFAAVVCESICVPLGIEPPLHRRRVRFYKNNRAFSIDKARKILQYEPKVDLEEGMRRTVKWYREHGYLV